MNCGIACIKYLLFIFNFVFALCGLGILIVGVLIHLKLTEFSDALADNVHLPSILLIVIGSIIFVIAFFGCCGAIRESHCMVVTFAVLLLTILIIQVAVGIYTFILLKNADELNIKENYQSVFNDYYKNNASSATIDAVQSSLQCCGVNSPSDFSNYIPWSCCGNSEGSHCTVNNSYTTGCVEALKDFLTYAGNILGGFAIGVAVVQLLGIIFALCLANSIKNDERRGYRV
ncbi:CD63 antigen [Cephus cinctus]|uniref:Tetraspanin n=1 Tax=Cephus cinctus TaxID=211228 RepID=A0AAJ7BV02_CEPCN|nr:CD63 antigen [Cephus cinctus]